MSLSQISFDISSLDLESGAKVAHVLEAEGAKGAWLTENTFRDAFVEIAVLSNSTRRLRFGTMIAGIFSRSPMITALSSITISNLSRGRFVLGLGAQTKNSVEYWYGKRFEKPRTQMMEFVAICRQLLSGSRVTYEGKFQHVNELQLPPSSYPVKIFIAAINPKMIQLAGQIADGILGTFWTPSYIRNHVIPNLKIGAEKAGRSLEGFEVLCSIDCFPANDTVANDALKPHLISVATVPLFAPIFRVMGYESELELIKKAILHEDLNGAFSIISTDMLRDLEVYGSFVEIRSKLQEFRSAGLTETVVSPYVGNVFYEHYPAQFPFEITKYDGTPVYDATDEHLSLIQGLK